VLLGVSLPLPPGAGTAEEKAPGLECAESLSLAVQQSGILARMPRLTPQQRRCVVAQLYALCASGRVADAERKRRQALAFDAEQLQRARALQATSFQFRHEACAGVEATDDTLGFIKAVSNAWVERGG
jgi:hypothetical protein